MKKRLRIAAMGAAMVLATTMMSSMGTAVTTVSAKAPEPTKLTIATPGFATETLNEKSPVFLKIQEVTNTQLTLNFIPDASFNEKLSAMIAGNTLPEVTYVGSLTSNNILQGIKGNAFWQIDSYLPKYDNLKQYNPKTLLRASVEGKTYGLYRERDMARLGIQYRKDWAENVGITKPPSTIDEFYDMCKKFVENDPNKSGKKDTIAISEQSSMGSFQTVIAWFGAGPGGATGWTERDGKVVPTATTEEYIQGVTFLRKLFAEGMINKDFITLASRSSLLRTGVSGITLGAIDDANGNIIELKKLIPTAELAVAPSVDAGKGLIASAENAGFKGYYVFPKTKLKTEANLQAALAFFNRLNTTDMNNLLAYGIEGTHYTVKSGKASRTDEQKALFAKDSNDLGQLRTFNLSVNPAMPEELSPLAQNVRETIDTMEKYVVAGANGGLFSDTNSKKGSEINKLLTDAQAKYIMGNIDEKELRAQIDAWRKQGGEDIIKEFNDSFKAAKEAK